MTSPLVSLKYLLGMATLSYATVHTCDGVYNKKRSILEIIEHAESSTIEGFTRALTLPNPIYNPTEEKQDTEEGANEQCATKETALMIDLDTPPDRPELHVDYESRIVTQNIPVDAEGHENSTAQETTTQESSTQES